METLNEVAGAPSDLEDGKNIKPRRKRRAVVKHKHVLSLKEEIVHKRTIQGYYSYGICKYCGRKVFIYRNDNEDE